MTNTSASVSVLQHLDDLVARFPVLVSCRPEVEHAFQMMRASYLSGNKALICGNGGSASDAEHWAGELLKGFCKLRPLSPSDRQTLPEELGARLQGGLPIIPLTGFPALSSAFANDVAHELTFAQLVWALGRKGDVFIGISTSGNARNVCAAAQAARGRGMPSIALTGETGGVLRTLCDLTIGVPVRQTHLVQELHLPIYHCLSLMLEDEFFPDLA
jgi:D-sedoheptulose 7-phosphate isomerase